MKAMTTTEPAALSPDYRPRPLASLLCDLLPSQGSWSDDSYLWLTDHGKRLVELTDGHIQELPMPTAEHGVFGRGGAATSALLEGFAADVSAVFDAPESGA